MSSSCSSTPSHFGQILEPEKRYVFVPLLRWAGVGAVLGAMVGVLSGDVGGGMAAIVMAAVGLGSTAGLLHSLLWWWGPCATRYCVSEGDLVVMRRDRVIARWPARAVVAVEAPHAMTWTRALLSGWFGYGPLVEPVPIETHNGDVWSPANGVHWIPGILLWGDSAERWADLLRCLGNTAGHPIADELTR